MVPWYEIYTLHDFWEIWLLSYSDSDFFSRVQFCLSPSSGCQNLAPGAQISDPSNILFGSFVFCVSLVYILFSENCSDIFIYVTIRDSKRPCYHPVGAHQQPFERVTKNHLVKHCNYILIFKPDWFMWCACSWIGDIYARTETGEGAPCLKRHSGTQTGPRPTF